MKILPLGTLAIALWVASPSWAQNGVQQVRPGQTVAGTLTTADRAYSTGRHFRVFRLDARQGQTYEIELRSRDFDALVQVTAPAGPVTETVASDDDGGENRDALVRFTPAATGPYLLVATSIGGDSAGLGAFELEVREEVFRPAASRPLALDDSVRGELGPQSATDPGTRARYDVYTFGARKGQRLRVALTTGTGPNVEAGLGVMIGGAFRPLGGEQPPLRRQIRPEEAVAGATTTLVVPDDGEYAAIVVTAPGVRSAPYTLRLLELPPVRTVPRRAPIAASREVSDTLSEGDPRDNDQPFREWLYLARAGERLTVTMRSAEFDAYLAVGSMRDGRFVESESNDDWMNTDARVTMTVPETQEYVIRAMSLAGETGAYTIRVDSRAALRQALRTGRIQVGQEVTGTLDETDAVLDLDGSPYEQWLLRANAAGERVVVTLRSTQFDTFLSMGRMEQGEFREYWSNDDALGRVDGTGRVSRVIAVLPAPGDYVIRVNTFSREGTGNYALNVERRPFNGSAGRTGAAP